MLKKQNGITLIALAITIVVLIILAGVSITIVTDDEGVVTKAKTAAQETELAGIKGDIQVAITRAIAEERGNLSDSEFESVLKKYGTLNNDKTVLTTDPSKTNTEHSYAINVSELYYGDTVEDDVTKYTVRFYNYDGTFLAQTRVNAGTVANYSGATPVRTQEGNTTYTFANKWSNESGEEADISSVQKDMDVYAMFTEGIVQYTVRFLDYDGTELQKVTVNAGESVTYTGTTTPSRASDSTYSYTFSRNWTLTNGGTDLADLSNVQSDLVLYPVFNTTMVCFVSGTKVLTENGLISIENIKPGMKVYSYNEVTRKVELKEVTKTFINYVNYSMTKVTVNGKVIESTSGHDYYVVGEGWMDACKIKVGDKLLNSNNEEVTVENVETIEFNGNTLNTVYNFEVEDNHNYYVGEDCVLVHNASVGHGSIAC